MVRLSNSHGDTIQLRVCAPRSLLPEAKLIDAKLASTWYEVLRSELNLELKPEDSIYACSITYNPKAPDDKGWIADLSETVSVWVNKFERKKKCYWVRLYKLDNVTTSSLTRTPGTSGGGPQIVIATQGSSRQLTNGGGHGPSPVVADYSRPRYVHTTNGNQQQKYGTRLKRQSEETRREGGTSGGRSAQMKAMKRARTEGMTNGGNQVTSQRQPGPPPKKTVSFKTVPSVVKVERTTEEEETEEEETVEEFWDESLEDHRFLIEEENGFEEEEEMTRQQEEELNWQEDEEEETRVVEDEVVDEGQEEDDFDAASLCTAVTQEEIELRREGIQVENAKDFAMTVMGRFSNAFMLRVRKEIEKNKKNNLWDRNVSRSPLSCYLLQELFKAQK